VAEAPALSAELKKDACHIIDEYMCDGANTPVNLPSANPFKKRSNKTPDEKFSVVMFDKMAKIIYKSIEQDIFKRFALGDRAAQLARDHPHLCEEGAADPLDENSPVQVRLQEELHKIQDLVGFERGTIWLVDLAHGRMWAACSSQLGNSAFAIDVGTGLAGTTAQEGTDLCVNDVAADSRSSSAGIDKQTAFVTKQALCVALKNESGATPVVVQLLNKTGDPPEFKDEHAEQVRTVSEGILAASVDWIFKVEKKEADS